MPADTAHVVHIPEASHLGENLQRIAEMPRADCVAAIRALRTREMESIAAFQQQHLNEITGLDVVTSITAVVDAVVRMLAWRAFAKVGAPKDCWDEVGVFAVGGYGRGEMNPSSDLDLLVLARSTKPPAWFEKAYAELHSLCWDVKFSVGASKRTLPELTGMLDEDFVTATAVIEQRPLLAGDGLCADVAAMLERLRRRRALHFLRYKLDELAKRRDQAGASLFLMEPNLKSNPGCMRDVQLLRNIAFIVFGSRNLLALTELEVISRQDLAEVAGTGSHLLQLRSLLHFHHGRKQDVFQLADQVRVARQLGYSDVSRLRAVEHFMKRHFAQVLHVHQMVDLTISRLRALGHLGRRPILVLSRKVLTPDFTAVDGRVYLSSKDFWKHADAAARLLRLCRQAQSRDLRLSLELQRAIKANLACVTDEVRHDRLLGRIFLEILGDAGRAHPILYDMHNAGLLGAWLPEFGNLTCHMQFTSYHQYTVDQHTLLAMRYLDDVALGRASGLPGMPRIFPTVKRKDLLALSLLLHDMGKYMGRGHVPRGALMVAPVAQRLGLDAEEEDLVYFLVDRHVALSDASRMRDFHEASFLAAFAERMGTVERLDALYCLTWCDAKAVGDGILTGWQEALIGELRDVVAQRLTSGGMVHAVGYHDRLIQELAAAGIPRDAAEDFLAGFASGYAHQVLPAECVKHFRAAEQAAAAGGHGVGMIVEPAETYTHLSVTLPDRHGLLADAAATLTGHGFDIIDARTWVSRRGTVFYSLRLSCIFPAKLKEDATWARLRSDLAAVARGAIDAGKQLERRRNTVLANRPADSGFDDPAVKVEQRTSDHYTIVDVHTKDEVGLLSRLCRGISTFDCDIGYACINTMGDVAVDVFYVVRDGAKLPDADAEALRRHLIAILNLVEGRETAVEVVSM